MWYLMQYIQSSQSLSLHHHLLINHSLFLAEQPITTVLWSVYEYTTVYDLSTSQQPYVTRSGRPGCTFDVTSSLGREWCNNTHKESLNNTELNKIRMKNFSYFESGDSWPTVAAKCVDVCLCTYLLIICLSVNKFVKKIFWFITKILVYNLRKCTVSLWL